MDVGAAFCKNRLQMKFAMDNGVKLEMYMDGSNINNWTKVSDITDRGGWYTKSNNTEFDTLSLFKGLL